jgi:hypothetical protein
MSLTYHIPEVNLETFKSKFEKLVKRATKLNVTIPTYTIINDYFKKIQIKNQDVLVRFFAVTITNPVVKAKEWFFIASLEHTEEGNITHNISGHDIPKRYWDCAPNCEHCNLKRKRNDTFVVMKEFTAEYKQVGSSCLTEFLGIDGSIYASQAEIYSAVIEMAYASQDTQGQGDSRSTYNYLDHYLQHVVEVITHEDWVSSKYAKDSGRQSTANIAYKYMATGAYGIPPYEPPSEVSLGLAIESIEWCENLTDAEVESSEYLHNIRVIARRGVVGQKQYGYAASIFPAYQKALLEEMKKSQIKKESEYVGVISQRHQFYVNVDSVKQIETKFGTTQLHNMHDALGNQYVWFSSGKIFDVGEWINIAATVKSFSQWKGVKQTNLTRCELVTK